MRHLILTCCTVAVSLACFVASSTRVSGQDSPDEKKVTDKSSASRLKAVREVMAQISMTSTEGDEPKPLELNPNPLLRYNDVTRGILDSVVFRIGTKGRPVALISAELYGRAGTNLALNHEFVALSDPKFSMKRDRFVWKPAKGNLSFQEFPASEPPAEMPRLRLAQMRRLSEQFTASQTVGNSAIILRRLATPLDRYEPSNEPRADGSLFAFAWGVNPEAVLFIESDGKTWHYAWAPLSSAPLQAKLGEDVVWSPKDPPEHESRTAPYTSIHRQLTVPDYFDDLAE